VLTFGLEFVENPGGLEGGLTHLFFFFFFSGVTQTSYVRAAGP
jgi:hypothetical protein